MPALSAFTELGLLDLSGEMPLAEKIYRAIWANLGTDNFASGGHVDAVVYAWAMGFARLHRAAGTRLEDQITADTVLDLLPAREHEFGIDVPAGATLTERRSALRAAMLAAIGGTRTNIEAALYELLGDDFVALRVTTNVEKSTWPSDPADGPGNFRLPEYQRKTLRTRAAISVGLGAPQSVLYEAFAGGDPDTAEILRVGDHIVIEPEIPDRAEHLVVTGSAGTAGAYQVTAIFENAHEPWALIITAPWPLWMSTKRHYVVKVSAAAAISVEKRRIVHALMRKMARGVSTWSIVSSYGELFADTSPVDATGMES